MSFPSEKIFHYLRHVATHLTEPRTSGNNPGKVNHKKQAVGKTADAPSG
jgi:hypothetical protein